MELITKTLQLQGKSIKVIFGHTKKEWDEAFANNSSLWSFSFIDIVTEAIELDSDITYWHIGNRFYETLPEPAQPLAMKTEEELKAEFMNVMVELYANEYKANVSKGFYGALDMRCQSINDEPTYGTSCASSLEGIWDEVWEKYFEFGNAEITEDSTCDFEMYYNDEYEAYTQDAGFIYHGYSITPY